MRLFIAIDLPENVKAYLSELQSKLPQAQMSLTRDFHLTLKFLGECDRDEMREVAQELDQIKVPPLKAKLSQIGTFGGFPPKVVWIRLDVPQFLFDTAREIEKKMVTLGFKEENRFVPHLTLCRVKSVQNPQKFLDALKLIKVEPMEFTTSQFHLVESHLSSSGAVYKKLASFPDKVK
jgi:2'-5' RNA ligase